jgi:uncharacterized protein (DUF4415 family)
MNKNTTTPTLAEYNPDDLESVENFWQGASIEHQGKIIGTSRRIQECEAAKIQVTLNLSPRVLEFFKNKGSDWQTRMDEALIEYIEAHHV